MGSTEHAIHGRDVSASCVAILIVVAHRRKEVLSAGSSGHKEQLLIILALVGHPNFSERVAVEARRGCR